MPGPSVGGLSLIWWWGTERVPGWEQAPGAAHLGLSSSGPQWSQNGARLGGPDPFWVRKVCPLGRELSETSLPIFLRLRLEGTMLWSVVAVPTVGQEGAGEGRKLRKRRRS